MNAKIFFFGTGSWSNNYISLIKKKFKTKIKIICIITENSNFFCEEFEIENNIEDALSKYGIPDGFIVCTTPNKNPDILSKIINFNKPIIMEKPICLERDLVKLENILLNSTNKKILVNHFHFYDNSFHKFINEYYKKTEFEIKIVEGNLGPYREFSPLVDWGVHAFGIIYFLCPNIEQIYVKKVKILNKVNIQQLNYYILINNKDDNKIFKILVGNNFKSKKRYLKAKLKHKTKYYYVNHRSFNKKSNLETLLDIFYLSMNNKTYFPIINTLDLAVNSIKIIKKILHFKVESHEKIN